MNNKCVLRKPRKNNKIRSSEKLFNKYINEKDYERSGEIILLTVLELFGEIRIINALYDANSFIMRSKKRKGL